jgi:hypothetical protein
MTGVFSTIWFLDLVDAQCPRGGANKQLVACSQKKRRGGTARTVSNDDINALAGYVDDSTGAKGAVHHTMRTRKSSAERRLEARIQNMTESTDR